MWAYDFRASCVRRSRPGEGAGLRVGAVRLLGGGGRRAAGGAQARGLRGAEPGDVLKVEILDLKPRPSANPDFAGKTFGSNAAAWWGYHYNDLIGGEDAKREVITI